MSHINEMYKIIDHEENKFSYFMFALCASLLTYLIQNFELNLSTKSGIIELICICFIGASNICCYIINRQSIELKSINFDALKADRQSPIPTEAFNKIVSDLMAPRGERKRLTEFTRNVFLIMGLICQALAKIVS